MAITYSDFFTKSGKAFFAANTCNTAVETTVPDEVEDFVQQFGSSESLELHRVIEGLTNSISALKSAGISLTTAVARESVRTLLVQIVKEDNPQLDDSVTTALSELIRQMEADAESIDASTPSVTPTYGASNTGNGVFVCSVRRSDGKVNEHILAEDIEGEITGVSTDGIATWSLRGEASVSLMSSNWPAGSGVTRSIPSYASASNANLVSNASFETADTLETDLPSGWVASVATMGTTLKLTTIEVQTVIISGTPTGGYYTLSFTDSDGDIQTTVPLTFNATQSTVEAAIQALDGLSAVTVVTTGTTPDYTHTITLTGVKNPGQFTSTDSMTGGTPNIAHATSTAGSANVVRGARAVEFDSNASELTTLNRKVTLQPSTQYAVSALLLADVVPAAGVMTFDLVDGIGGTVLRDEEGFQNTCQFACADLLTTFQTLPELVSAVNEVQTLTITGTPTGGTFTVTFDGQTTGAIAYNADAATVETAIEALSNVGAGNATCSGGALPGTPVVITFTGALAARDVPLATANGASLTGGTTPDAAIALTTQGSPASPVFRTPATLPPSTYLRIRISTAVSAGTSVFCDEVVLVPMTELYTGGPFVASFTGSTEWALGDTSTLPMANDRAGALHEWMNRAFDLRENNLLIPTNSTGSETIADSLIA